MEPLAVTLFLYYFASIWVCLYLYSFLYNFCPKMISCWFQRHGAVGCYIPPLSTAERKERDQNGDWERRRPVLGLLTSFVAPIQVLGCLFNICIIIVIVIVFVKAFLSSTVNVRCCTLLFAHKLSWIICQSQICLFWFCSHKCCQTSVFSIPYNLVKQDWQAFNVQLRKTYIYFDNGVKQAPFHD